MSPHPSHKKEQNYNCLLLKINIYKLKGFNKSLVLTVFY